MNNFFRAIRLVLNYPFTLGAGISCSLLVAVLWGGNIGALYPILQITLQKQPLQDWAREEVTKAEKKSDALREQIDALQRQLPGLPDSERPSARTKIDEYRQHLRAEQKTLSVKRRLIPWLDRCLPRDPYYTVAVIVFVLLVATAVKDAAIVANMSLIGYLCQLVTLQLRQEFHARVLLMDARSFDRRGTGPLITLCDRGTDAIGNGLRNLFGNAIREPLKMIACLVGAAWISWRLLLFVMVLAPLAVVLMRMLAAKIRRVCRASIQDDLVLNTVMLEAFNGLRTVQAYTMESRERKRFRHVCRQRLEKATRIVFWSALAKPVTELIGISAVGIAILAGAHLVLNQETELLGIQMCDRPLSLPTLLVFYGMLIGMSDPARKLSDVFGTIQLGVSAAERVFGVMDQPIGIVEPPQPRPLPAPHRRIVFENVSFHYTPREPVLNDINVSIEFGETLAIVGPNGCGKTTMANLVPRFYDPAKGRVRIDDVNLREASLKELRQKIGMVSQQTFLFDDTVLNNILFGAPHATTDQVIEAAKRAGAHEFIEGTLENGYDTMVGANGNRLSGGQRQRLALARAILKDPEIFILDEATSQVDPHSEQLIQGAIERFVGQRTTIIITHRLSTLNLADRILVLDRGNLAAMGTHEELLSDCPLYRQLFGVGLRQSA